MKHTIRISFLLIGISIYTIIEKEDMRCNNIIFENIEALAMDVENNNTHVWCCGNTETCIKGENFKINGKYQLTPCK